jgi:hypothetical protein
MLIRDFRELAENLPDSPARLRDIDGAMKRQPPGRKKHPAPESARATVAPELPAWKAFVVQFSRDASSQGTFAGRIEHLSSGRRARFNSREELLAVLIRQLDELGRDAD